MLGVLTIVALGSGVGDWIGLCLALVAGFGYGGMIVTCGFYGVKTASA